MKRLRLAWPALCLSSATLVFGRVADLELFAACLTVVFWLAVLWNRRVTTSLYAANAGISLVTALAILLTVFLREPDQQLFVTLLLGCAITSVCLGGFRMFLSHPRWGHRGTIALALVPMMELGATPASVEYLVALAVYLAGAVGTLLTDDAAAPSVKSWSMRRRVGAGFVAAVAAGIAVGLALALPPLHKVALDRVMNPPSYQSRTGFSRHFALGSLANIMESHTVMLRVYNTDPLYLRGVVYRYYRNGYWSGNDELNTEFVIFEDLSDDKSSWLRIERAGGVDDQYFTPPDAGMIAVEGGLARRSQTGILFPHEDVLADVLLVRRGGGVALEPSAPAADDVRVDETLRDALSAYLADNDLTGTHPLETARRIQRHLQTFEYTLHSERKTNADPVVDFLLHEQSGHCEYFASAMALLARRAGIPARVVGGYYVNEKNGWADFMVARQRDAHAWTELWFDGHGWVMFDATPSGALALVSRPSVAAWRQFYDYAVMVVITAWNDLSEEVLWWLVGFLVALSVLLRVRALMAQRGTRSKAATDEPPGVLHDMLQHLERAGLSRGRAETLEQFAERVAGASVPNASEIDLLLRRYVALRFGNLGSEAELVRDFEALRR